MRQLWTVVRFELSSYYKNKGYVVTTILLTLILSIGLCIPRFLGADNDQSEKSSVATEDVGNGEVGEVGDVYLILDEAGVLSDMTYLENNYGEYEWKVVSDKASLESEVKAETAQAGFIIKTPTSYEYVVNNSEMYDSTMNTFDEILSYYYRANYMKEHNIDVDKMQEIINTKVESKETILGKDGVGSYAYTYILIFVIYFMILFYGQMIAVSITTEKSNRAIEVLVTSSKPDYLIFGKVFAGAIASFLQVGIILGAGLLSYHLNATFWSGMLNGLLGSLFDIPTEVLIVFAIFVIFGFLFYSFLYASLGALVSKTEDISKSVGPVMMIFIVGFMLAVFGLNDPNGMLIRVASFIPFTSSYMMLIRTAMGSVTILELVISAIILIMSSVLTGILGAKVYRMGTLHYGNPLKLSNVLKRIIRGKE